MDNVALRSKVRTDVFKIGMVLGYKCLECGANFYDSFKFVDHLREVHGYTNRQAWAAAAPAKRVLKPPRPYSPPPSPELVMPGPTIIPALPPVVPPPPVLPVVPPVTPPIVPPVIPPVPPPVPPPIISTELDALLDIKAEMHKLETDYMCVEFSLAAANMNKKLGLFGISLTIVKLDGDIAMRFDDERNDPITISALTWPSMITWDFEFDQVYLTNTAQVGKVVQFFAGRREG